MSSYDNYFVNVPKCLWIIYSTFLPLLLTRQQTVFFGSSWVRIILYAVECCVLEHQNHLPTPSFLFSLPAKWTLWDQQEDLPQHLWPPPWDMAAFVEHPYSSSCHHWFYAHPGQWHHRFPWLHSSRAGSPGKEVTHFYPMKCPYALCRLSGIY